MSVELVCGSNLDQKRDLKEGDEEKSSSDDIDHPQQPVTANDIENKHEILKQIDEFLGVEKPPAIEFIFVEAAGRELACLGSVGHAALRYTPPKESMTRSGYDTSRVVNITQATGEAGEGELVELWGSPADYLVGSYNVPGAGGMHARNICSIRIEEWDPNALKALHYYLLAVRASARMDNKSRGNDDEVGYVNSAASDAVNRDEKSRDRSKSSTSFHFIAGLFDPWRARLGFRAKQHGNCSQWTSRALFLAGATEREHMFPKASWVDLFESLVLDNMRASRSNLQRSIAHVVYWERVPRKDGEPRPAFKSMVAPLYFVRSAVYNDLRSFADVLVRVKRVPTSTANDAEKGVGSVVAASKNGKDTKLVAELVAGQKRRPLWMRSFCGRHHHTIAMVLLFATYFFIGPPWSQTDEWHNLAIVQSSSLEEQCNAATWIARFLVVVVFTVINGALY